MTPGLDRTPTGTPPKQRPMQPDVGNESMDAQGLTSSIAGGNKNKIGNSYGGGELRDGVLTCGWVHVGLQ